MSKMYTGAINLSKIQEDKRWKAKSGDIYTNVIIWINDEPDDYGNQMSIQSPTDKGQDKIYLGAAKEYVKKDKTGDLPF